MFIDSNKDVKARLQISYVTSKLDNNKIQNFTLVLDNKDNNLQFTYDITNKVKNEEKLIFPIYYLGLYSVKVYCQIINTDNSTSKFILDSDEISITKNKKYYVSLMLYYYSGNEGTIPLGVYYDGSSSTKLQRVFGNKDYNEPFPSIANKVGFSIFDQKNIYKDMMTIVENSNLGKLVKIPKFYYRFLKYDDGSFELCINFDGNLNGFKTSPVHRDRNDGKGEKSVAYINRYFYTDSASSLLPARMQKLSVWRQAIHDLGTNVYLMDFSMLVTIWFLYLVEFADFNIQKTIGAGCIEDSFLNSQNVATIGSTDSMPYHTGTIADRREIYTRGTQYRNIEGLWSLTGNIIDGMYIKDNIIYIIDNPDDFGDITKGISLNSSVGKISDGRFKSYRNFKTYNNLKNKELMNSDYAWALTADFGFNNIPYIGGNKFISCCQNFYNNNDVIYSGIVSNTIGSNANLTTQSEYAGLFCLGSYSDSFSSILYRPAAPRLMVLGEIEG